MLINVIITIILITPLLSAIISSLFLKKNNPINIIVFIIVLIGLSFILSLCLAHSVYVKNEVYTISYFNWAILPNLVLKLSITIDQLSLFMVLIVSFISMLVHIYSIGYMSGDKNSARFFAYISGFTFTMLVLVMADNFLLLFFGWEGVSLFSYLLIGYYFDCESANKASLSAFIINRIADLGLLFGIAAVFIYCNTLDYNAVFSSIDHINNEKLAFISGLDIAPLTLISILFFIGTMGKSAQFPLHIWLEGSMEGPTPTSALIHSATMVTAGVFLILRLSPIFVHSSVALSFVMIIGGITCLLMGLIAITQVDIKKVIAYCTLSQLGYMMVAAGSTGFSISLFHLMTHSCFKSLLFLAAGSVIISMHYEQDIRNMGGLRKKMPITYFSMFIGGWSLSALPPFSGFFSKDLIIEASKITTVPGHTFAYYIVLACTFITSFYIFRMIFMTFHGESKMNKEIQPYVKESSITILIPLIILSILSMLSGVLSFKLLSTSNQIDNNIFFSRTIGDYIQPVLGSVTLISAISGEEQMKTPWDFIIHSIHGMSIWLGLFGVGLSYILYVLLPKVPKLLVNIKSCLGVIHFILIKKYFIEYIYDIVFVKGIFLLSRFFWVMIDMFMIDTTILCGSVRVIHSISCILRKIHRGYVFDYLIILLVGVLGLMLWLILWVNV